MRQIKKRVLAETFDEHGVLTLTDRGEEVLSKEPVAIPLPVQNRRHTILDWIRAEHMARMEARMVETLEDAQDFGEDEGYDLPRSPYEVPDVMPTLERPEVSPASSPAGDTPDAPSPDSAPTT